MSLFLPPPKNGEECKDGEKTHGQWLRSPNGGGGMEEVERGEDRDAAQCHLEKWHTRCNPGG